MPKILWNQVGERQFERGVDRGVLYLPGKTGIPWNGLISVDEGSSGGELKELYIDGQKVYNQYASEDYVGAMTAFMYPDEFAACDGSWYSGSGVSATQQVRKPFNLAYRTLIGNDVQGLEAGYKLHLLYNVMAAPTTKSYGTVNAEVSAMPFSWTLSAKPMVIIGRKPSSHIIIDSTLVLPSLMAQLEAILYGSSTLAARMPTPAEVFDLLEGFTDTFNRPNGVLGVTSRDGIPWRSLPGTPPDMRTPFPMGVVNNQIKRTGTTGTNLTIWYIDSYMSNGVIRATVGAVGDYSGAIAFRIKDTQNFLQVVLRNGAGNNRYFLMQRVNNVLSILASGPADLIPLPRDLIEVSLKGGNIVVKINGSPQLISTNNNFIDETRAGIPIGSSQSGEETWDSLSWTAT